MSHALDCVQMERPELISSPPAVPVQNDPAPVADAAAILLPSPLLLRSPVSPARALNPEARCFPPLGACSAAPLTRRRRLFTWERSLTFAACRRSPT